MKKTIRFSAFFIPAVVISSVVVLSGIIGVFTKGFNMGVDFRAGLNESVRLAIPALEVSYSGVGNAQFKLGQNAAQLVLSATQNDQTIDMPYDQYKSSADIVAKLNTVPGISAQALGEGTVNSADLIPTEQSDTALTTTPSVSHRKILSSSEEFASIEQVRKAVSVIGEVAVQTVGTKGQQQYMIRVEDKGNDPAFSSAIRPKVRQALSDAFGADKVVVVSADIVGASFSKNLGTQTVWLVGLALLCIYIYCSLRFKQRYAIGAILSIVHDAMVMIAYIIWTGMEFNTSSIAAILTILGYSINDTIVVYDRIRENLKLAKNQPFKTTMDEALTQVLSRTIITSLTVLICVVILFIFTTGSMKDFAEALMVGVISGTYSSIYIASAFVDGWETLAVKFRSKKEGHKVSASSANANP